MIKARPILFSGEMIRAILSGRKTQTRRVIRDTGFYALEASIHGQVVASRERANISAQCPYGQPGDLLWVKETHALVASDDGEGRLIYRASCKPGPYGSYLVCDEEYHGNWTPSINMPRWASRITLEITNVRVERVQDISESDAIAEGLSAITKDGKIVKYGIPDFDGLPGTDNCGWPWSEWDRNPVDAFRKLWDSIYARLGYSWESNPWVWVVEFRKMEQA